MYQCNEQIEHKKAHPTEPSLCSHCTQFMHEADKCLEDSIITPVFKRFYPDSEECYFHDDGTGGKADIIFVKQSTSDNKATVEGQ